MILIGIYQDKYVVSVNGISCVIDKDSIQNLAFAILELTGGPDDDEDEEPPILTEKEKLH
jgi:hypothetical protein